MPDLRVERVDDGERVGPFDVYYTPGHTAGHVAYEHEERSSLFVGDLVIARDGRLRVSPWPVSHDTDAVAASVVSLADRAPAAEVLAVGHGRRSQSAGAWSSRGWRRLWRGGRSYALSSPAPGASLGSTSAGSGWPPTTTSPSAVST